MTDPISNERLAELASGYEAWSNSNSALPQIDRETASALRELQSRRQSPAGVEVKGLAWRVPTDRPDEMEDSAILIADGLGGLYAISHPQSVGPKFLLWWAHDPFDWTGFDTPEAAKAAAQADYERRVLSCIVTHKPASGDKQDDLPLTDEMVERVFQAVMPFMAGTAYRELRAALTATLSSEAQPTHHHKKRGTEYVLIGIGKMQSQWWFEPSYPIGEPVSVDMREVAIYRSVDDGSLWVRPREEFEDGRFEVLSSEAHNGQ